MSNTHREDVFGYLEELRQALSNPDLEKFDANPDEDAERAAARVAVALGYCRVFGLDAGEDAGVLPVAEALGAAHAFSTEVRELESDIDKLPGKWDMAEDGTEQESLCADILERRMDLWVGLIALNEAALEAILGDDAGAWTLSERLDSLSDAVDHLDDRIQQPEILGLLSTLVATELISNWRQLLVEPYASIPPYWLDGTLEEVDRQCQRALEQTLARFPKRTGSAERARRAALVIRDLRPIALAADTPAPSAPVILLRWRSPDGRYLAQLPYARTPIVGQKVKLTIRRAETSELADELAGATVDCAGDGGRLGPDARMDISLDVLRAAAQSADELPLRVNDVPWEELPPIGGE